MTDDTTRSPLSAARQELEDELESLARARAIIAARETVEGLPAGTPATMQKRWEAFKKVAAARGYSDSIMYGLRSIMVGDAEQLDPRHAPGKLGRGGRPKKK